MPRTEPQSTDSTVVGGRLTVSLPKEVAADLKKLTAHFEAEFENHMGIHVDMSPAQVIHAAIKRAAETITSIERDVEQDLG